MLGLLGAITSRAMADIVGFTRSTQRVLFPGFPPEFSRQPYPSPAFELDHVDAVQKVPMVYSCISKIANDVAGLPLRFYQGNERKNIEIEREPGNITDLWAKANPVDNDFTLTRGYQVSLDATGNGFLFIDKFGSETPTPDWELWNMPGHVVRVTVDEHRIPLGYEWLGGTATGIIDPRNVIHIPYFSPQFEPRGMSPLEAARLGYETRYLMGRWNREFYKRGAQMNMLFSTTDPNTRIDPVQMKALKEDLRRMNAGLEHAYDPVIAQGLKPERRGMTQQEMNYVETLDWTDADICRVFGIPPVIMGIKQGGGLSDAGATTDLLLYYIACLQPRTNLRDRVLSEALCKLFDPSGRIFCKTDYSGVLALQDAKLAQSKSIVVATGRPIMTVNEGRLGIGLDRLDDPEADKLYVPPAPAAAPPGGPGGADGAGKGTQPAPKRLAGPQADPAAEARLIAAKRATARRKGQARIELANRKFSAEMRRIFTAQEQRALRRLRGLFDLAGHAAAGNGDGVHRRVHINVEDLFGDDDTLDLEALEALFQRLVTEQGDAQLADLGVELEVALNAHKVSRYVQAEALQLLTQTSATTRKRLREAFTDLAAKGDAVLGDYVAAVQDEFDGRRANALTIARTEVAGAYNFASLTAAEDSGVVETKSWLTAEDELVRVEHQHAEAAGDIPLEQPWVLTDAQGQQVAVDHPGDPSLPPELRCNCRCTMLFGTGLPYSGKAAAPRRVARDLADLFARR